jgi:hypothetical protein
MYKKCVDTNPGWHMRLKKDTMLNLLYKLIQKQTSKIRFKI